MQSLRATKLDCAAAFIIGSLIALLITAPVATAHPAPHADSAWRNNDAGTHVTSTTSISPDSFHDALQ